MKFGNYNISTVPKERSRKFDVFRFSKIKLTTNNFVGRFHSKIETFRRLKSRSESPLSFRASLFERDTSLFARNDFERFSPNDFPKHHFRADNFYVFGNTIRRLTDNQRTISGKNSYLSENFYCTLRSGGKKEPKKAPASRRNSKSAISGVRRECMSVDRRTWRQAKQCDALDQSSSGIGSYIEKDVGLSHSNSNTSSRRYTSSLKDLLDSVSHLDEDTEFKVLKEYFETNSYSDIIKDSAFKEYLSKKNYGDILEYLDEENQKSGTFRRRHTPHPVADNCIDVYDNSTDASKLYRWKSTGELYESLSSAATPANAGHQTADRLESGTYKRQRKPPALINNYTTSLNRRTNSKIIERQRERAREREQLQQSFIGRPYNLQHSTNYRDFKTRQRPVASEFNPTIKSSASRYDDMKRFCEVFLSEHFAFNSSLDTMNPKTLAKRYTERQYKKLIGHYVKSKGFASADDYVQAKFGSILDRSIPRNNFSYKSEKLDLPKTYIDNLQRRYHVTKQHFLAADRMRTLSSRRHAHSPNDLETYYTTCANSCSPDYKRTGLGDCRSALDQCTVGCMTLGRNRPKSSEHCATISTGSLPSTFRSARRRNQGQRECLSCRYFDSSTCDIYCSSCMVDHFNRVPYRREYYNVSNNHYDFPRRSPHQSRDNLHLVDSQWPRNYRHTEYNHIGPTLRSNYVNRFGFPPPPPLPPSSSFRCCLQKLLGRARLCVHS